LKVVPHVIEVADKFDAELHVIYVAHVAQYYGGLDLPSAYLVDFEAEVVNGAKKQLAEFLTKNFGDRQVKADVISGYPGDAIIKYSEAEGIDLIIMGHSRKGIKRVILGSVAGHVLRRSHIPVMVVNPEGVEGDDEE